jgi:hypothetical protein
MLVMVGLTASISKEEKKKQKGSPFIGDDGEQSSPTQLHP